MSYFNAVRKAGTCKNGDCEENDYLYDAPHLSSGILQPMQGTSYYAIERRAQALKGYNAWMDHAAPNAWEDKLFSIAA